MRGALLRPVEGGPGLLLAGVSGREAQAAGDVLAAGALTVAYGFALLYVEDYVLVQYAFDDFRRAYHGADALDFMLRQGDRFPRADVVGRRVSDGARADLFLKQVDVARGLQAFAFHDLADSRPVARIDGVVWSPAGVAESPPVLLQAAVPCHLLDPGQAVATAVAGLLDELKTH